MKNTILSLAFATLSIAATLKAQNVVIPDANFKANLVGNSAINTNNDSEIQVSEAAAFSGTINCMSAGISDFTGIETFTSVTRIFCDGNNLTNLDLSSNVALTYLQCVGSQIANLNVNGNVLLDTLICSNNLLTSLDVSNNPALKRLSCQSNLLTALDVSSNSALITLGCYDNPITSLDVSQNPALKILYSFNCQLTSLNVANGNNAAISDFYAYGNSGLTCIQVDDAVYSTSNWTGSNFMFDAGVSFSESCSVTTAVHEDDNSSKITVYPNPTNGQLYFSTVCSVRLMSATGQVLFNRININTLDVTELPAGLYYLNVVNSEGEVTQRNIVVKE